MMLPQTAPAELNVLHNQPGNSSQLNSSSIATYQALKSRLLGVVYANRQRTPMSSTLDRLRAAAASAAPAATAPEAANPAAQAQPTAQPTAEPTVQPTAQPTVQATPVVTPEVIKPAVQPTTTAVAVQGDVQYLPDAIQSTDDAQRTLAALFGGNSGGAKSLTEIVDGVDEGGVREAYPFAQVKKGNWVAYNKIPQNIFDAMPVGNRPYRMVYLAHRIGATAWQGSGDGTNKQPPIWAAAVPVPTVSPVAAELNMRLMKIGSKIQYTSGADRVKFDSVGRLTPEIHVFGWRPDTGFFVLTCSTFKGAELSIHAFSKMENKGGVPIVLNLAKEHQHNPRATDPRKKDWDVDYLQPDIVLDEMAQKLAGDFESLKTSNGMALAQECLKFARTEDYSGLNVQDLIAKLDQYAPLISR